MTQSTSSQGSVPAAIATAGAVPAHVAIIMDGNGRWAAARGKPRLEGHRAGAEAVRRTVEAAVAAGIGTLTLYAFSSDNWNRPKAEVAGLMALFHTFLGREAERCAENGVRLTVIGRRDRLGPLVASAMAAAEMRTAAGTRMHLRIAIDYSARDAILRAAATPGAADSRAAFEEALGRASGGDGRAPVEGGAPDVDLLVRTGGEQRLSDFLLWECAYAELVFTPRAWPDFGEADLHHALDAFAGRERRFGALPDAAAV